MIFEDWSMKYMLRAKQKSILVLDDDLNIGNVFKLGLQRSLGSDVFVFTDPLLALEHFKRNQRDMVPPLISTSR